MGKRRFAQVASDDDDDAAPVPMSKRRSIPTETKNDNNRHTNKRKTMRYGGGDVDEGESEEEGLKKKRKGEIEVKEEVEEEEEVDEEEEEEEENEEDGEEEEEEKVVEDAKPIGEVIRVSGKGRWRRNHYKEFEFDGLHYELEDSVLLVPEGAKQKPYVAIIQDISVDHKGDMNVMGQWFYRPEEAEKRGGGNWQSHDSRELFYSFHRDEIPAESVMHKCVVHFIPLNKQIPRRKEHPGFFVQKVYCTERKRLFKLTDKDYEDNKQEEIDLLVQKTMSRIGDLPDIELDDGAVDYEDQLISKRLIRKRNMEPLDVSREEEGVFRSAKSVQAETPGSCPSSMSEYYAILFKFDVLTGDSLRDKWLEKLLQAIHAVWTSVDGQIDGKEKNADDGKSPDASGSTKPVNAPEDKSKDVLSFHWPDSAVPAIAAIENEAHKGFPSENQKYNQKMRQMTFNLKCNAQLSRRLLNGELKPSQIVEMSPNELKAGLTAAEIESRQPEESQHLQMTDARCNRCSKKEVGVRDIIQAGTGNRYQLECTNCGNTWYASQDQAATLTNGGSSDVPKNVGTAPLATTKFEDVEKARTSPRETEKPAADPLKRTTEAFVPVLENQRSFNKTKTDANSGATRSG